MKKCLIGILVMRAYLEAFQFHTLENAAVYGVVMLAISDTDGIRSQTQALQLENGHQVCGTLGFPGGQIVPHRLDGTAITENDHRCHGHSAYISVSAHYDQLCQGTDQ